MNLRYEPATPETLEKYREDVRFVQVNPGQPNDEFTTIIPGGTDYRSYLLEQEGSTEWGLMGAWGHPDSDIDNVAHALSEMGVALGHDPDPLAEIHRMIAATFRSDNALKQAASLRPTPPQEKITIEVVDLSPAEGLPKLHVLLPGQITDEQIETRREIYTLIELPLTGPLQGWGKFLKLIDDLSKHHLLKEYLLYVIIGVITFQKKLREGHEENSPS